MDYNFYDDEDEFGGYYQNEGGIEEEEDGFNQDNEPNLDGEENENESDQDNDNGSGEDDENESDEEDLEQKEKEEEKNWNKIAKMCNCPTIVHPPFNCPDCGKHSLFIEPIAGLIIRDGILAIGVCFGVEAPADWYSPFYCCVNKKCASFYRNTGTKFYLNKESKELVKIKNYFHISR